MSDSHLADDHIETVLKAKGGDQRAASQLLRQYEDMLYKIALRYTIRNMTMEDKLQSAREGLLIAIRRFDPSKGASKLSTYATPWIHERLSLERSRSYCANVPMKKSKKLTTREGVNKHACEDSGLTFAAMNEPLTQSSSSDMKDDSIFNWEEFVSSISLSNDEGVGVTHSMMAIENHLSVQSLLNQCDDEQRALLAMSFGIDRDEPLSYSQIGKKLGMASSSISFKMQKTKDQFQSMIA